MNGGAFRYYDALQIFKNLTTNSKDFKRSSKSTMNSTYYSRISSTGLNNGYSTVERKFKDELRKIGVSDSEANSVWTFINDTFISAKTTNYPTISSFVLEDVDGLSNSTYMKYPYLYTSSSDQSRNVDFGIKLRQNADLWLSKDLYKTTILINGKKEEYLYNKKKSETDTQGNWKIDLSTGMYAFSNGSDANKRASNENYNGAFSYTREIRKSEYLYNGIDSGGTVLKNLQVYVTYKIAIKNQSQSIATQIDEIVDYYDNDQYAYTSSFSTTRNNTFIGDEKGNKTSNLYVSTSSIYPYDEYTLANQKGYSALYLTGFNGYLAPGDLTYAYITFKVKNDSSGKVKLDQEMTDLINGGTIRDKVGKKNIAEINGYSTREGVIDLDSNPGSLRPKDINDNGDIINSKDESINRLQDDTDKSPNLKLKIDNNDNNTRKISGYVFEDARTEVSDGAVIGNGKYNTGDVDFESNRDKKVNGVTVQLVELVQNVDLDGLGTGTYSNEKVWSSVTYNSSWSKSEDTSRYYSGTNKSKVILSGPGAFKVNPVGLTEGAGQYEFDSLPPGDFYVRFIYGDTTQTVLTNENNDVNNLLGEKGLNANAYTGQDYKSTVYQKGVNQNTSYNGINGYRNITNQNYEIRYQDNNPYTNETIVSSEDKQKMYNYGISESSIDSTISDAKDVYSYRTREQNYSSGSNLSVLSGNEATLKNHRAEVLASSTDLVTKASLDLEKGKTASAKDYQKQAITELMNNTYMVSQTGVMNTEIEYNRQSTNVYNTSNTIIQNLQYKIDNVNLGLTERPRAQLNISKELTNIQVKLANGQTLFDANQSVANLIYQKHTTYSESDYYTKVGTSGYRLRTALMKAVENRKEELVQATLDEELMSGATIRLSYKISVDNIGEIDYLDKNFYYLGKTNDSSGRTSNWRNVVKTSAMNVLDYVTNEINYEENYQEDGNEWRIVTADVLLGSKTSEDDDYVNSAYEGNLKTFNVLVTTDKLAYYLIPKALDTDKTNYSNSRREVSLILSTLLANTTSNKNLIFTNMVELIESKNTFGRRMYLSKSGNHYVPYQSENKTEDESTYWLKPNEPDEDSGQKVIVTVPTGANKNFNRAIAVFVCASAIIVGSVIAIKKKVLKDK